MQPRLRLADLKQWFPNFGMHQRFVKADFLIKGRLAFMGLA